MGRILAAVVTAALLIGATLLGFVLAGLLLGVALLGSLVFIGRVWWLRRRLRRTHPGAQAHAEPRPADRPAIDAEFSVVEPAAERSIEDRREH